MTKQLVFLTGATGHVGFATLVKALEEGFPVRASVRRASQAETIRSHPKVLPYVFNLEIVIVADITAKGAFDEVLEGVTYIEHIASPLPKPTENPHRDIIEPAINGTTSILNSALKFDSIRRIVITSSVAAVVPGRIMTAGDPVGTYSSSSRVHPSPSGPWNDFSTAYRDSKVLALNATERFMADNSPKFSIVNIMPGYVIGANELVTDARDISNGSNGVAMGIILGAVSPSGRAGNLVGVTDVARVHVAALNERLVTGNQNFVLDSQRPSINEIAEIALRAFPEEVKSGRLPLGGSIPTVKVKFDVEDTLQTFGALESYEKDVIAVVSQYLKLSQVA